MYENGRRTCNIKAKHANSFHKSHSMPFASIEKINQELDRLENVGILSKTEYNQWAAHVVYVKKKSGEIRVCADFSTGLNTALEDFHYPLPSPEEVVTFTKFFRFCKLLPKLYP